MKFLNWLKIIIKKHVKFLFYKYSNCILYLIAYILYFLSLESCLAGEELCGNNMVWIYKKLVELIFACEIISFLIGKIIFNYSSKLHIFHLIVIFSLFYYYSHDFYFWNHGMYNLIFFLFLFFFNLCFILFFKFIICLFRIQKKIYIINKIFIICFFFLIYIFKFPNFICDDWSKGLNNTYIDNDEEKYGCQIRIPKYCHYKVFSKYQDFTKFLGINCSIKKQDSRKVILKQSKSPYINKDTKKFGFIKTNEGMIGCKEGLDYKTLKQYMADNLFDVDNNFKNFSEPEIIVDFSNDSLGELSINLKYNDSLSKERKKLENKTNPYSNNILILFVDSISRASSLRQLNKTLQFFEKFISYEGGFNENYPEEKFHSFQFFKYHSFDGRTAGNYPRLFYGNKMEAKNIVRMNKYFKENGYITNYCSHLCQKDNALTGHNTTESELYDHQMLLCDPNAPRYSKPIRKCMYGKDDVGFLLDYSEQFWRKYQNNRKFSLLIINSAHEETMEVMKYIDGIIYNYLYSLYNDNLFKDSSIFLVSDHGVGIQSLYYAFEFYTIENYLPLLYIIINDRKETSYAKQYSYMRENQQTFITAYDIYNTINHLLYGDKFKYILNLTDENPTPKSPLGTSLFEKIDQKLRKSQNYEFMSHKICI